jgi:pimeloyl-ACP methyl ester carboxylesterase
MGLPDVVEQWRRHGRHIELGTGAVFVIDRGPRDAKTILVLHGFPGSTFEWRHVIDDLAADHRVVGHDFLGFGLSDKPRDADYSLFVQADRSERVVDALGVDRVVIVAHDIGDTVAAELLHRHRDGALSFDVAGCVLTNGSIFIDLVELSDGQRALLALPDEPLVESLGSELLGAGLAATFPPAFSDRAEIDAIVSLVEHNGGDLLLPRLIRYVDERRRHQPRWTAGLADTAIPMAAVWGQLDPIAVPAMADRLGAMRAAAGNEVDIVRWPESGHWPVVERPAEVAALIRTWAARWRQAG